MANGPTRTASRTDPGLTALPEWLAAQTVPVRLVSLDVFDTLLLRCEPPREVARRAARHLATALAARGDLRAWDAARLAEDILEHRRRYSATRDRDLSPARAEWSVRAWLHALARDAGLDPGWLAHDGLWAELRAERETTRRAPCAQDVLSRLRARGHRVVALSDTTLDGAMLRALLAHHSLAFDAIYASCDHGFSKRSGTAFGAVADLEGVDPRECAHAGDHWKSDLLRARSAGWRAFWIPRLPPRLPRPARADRASRGVQLVARALEAPALPGPKGPLHSLGADLLAPLLAIFHILARRVHRRDGVEAVWYLARDAFAMFDAAELLDSALPGPLPRVWVRLSRRAVALHHPARLLESARGLPGKAGRRCAGEFLAQFPLPKELHDRLLADSGLRTDSSWSAGAQHAMREAISRHRREIERVTAGQRGLLAEYLAGCSPGGRLPRRVGLVDTGWAATTQDALSALLPHSASLSGVYLGVTNLGLPPDARSRKTGLLRDDWRGVGADRALERTAGVLRIWDLLLRESAPSVRELERASDGGVRVVLAPWTGPEPNDAHAMAELRAGVRDGLRARLDGIALLDADSGCVTDADLEVAGAAFARAITARPAPEVARAMLRLRADEGAAGGREMRLDARGLREGVAWIPGIAAASGLATLQPAIEAAAQLALAVRRIQTSIRSAMGSGTGV